MSSYAQVAHSKHNIDVNNYCILLHWGKVTTELPQRIGIKIKNTWNDI